MAIAPTEARDPIAELQDKIKTAFTLYSSVALGRINRYFETAEIPVENRITFDGEPKQNGQLCARFYDVVDHSELPAVLLLSPDLIDAIKHKDHAEYGDFVGYLDGVHKELIDNLHVKHHQKFDLHYGSDRGEVGFGVNLPISNATFMKLNALAAKLLSAYPLEKIASQINGYVSLELPTRLIENALVVKLHQAKSVKPNATKEQFPQEFDIDRIQELLIKTRAKLELEKDKAPEGRE